MQQPFDSAARKALEAAGLLSAEEIQAIEGPKPMPPPPTTPPLGTAHHTTRLCTPSSSPLALAHARS